MMARSIDAATTKVLPGVEDGRAFRQGVNHQTSASDLATLQTCRKVSAADQGTLMVNPLNAPLLSAPSVGRGS